LVSFLQPRFDLQLGSFFIEIIPGPPVSVINLTRQSARWKELGNPVAAITIRRPWFQGDQALCAQDFLPAVALNPDYRFHTQTS
jgi:hypothetical protein